MRRSYPGKIGTVIDLGDAISPKGIAGGIADELSLPFDRISLEMIYRGLYHFYVAHQKGKANDLIKYFTAPENQDLGIVKRKRKPNIKLIVAPFPEKQRGTPGFFFGGRAEHEQASPKTPLTAVIQA